MGAIDKLYRIENYTIEKHPKIENELYNGLKRLEDIFDAKYSQLVNVCIEDFFYSEEKIYHYKKPKGEIAEYRKTAIRIESYKKLEKTKKETGLAIDRQINLAIKRFLEKYEKINGL